VGDWRNSLAICLVKPNLPLIALGALAATPTVLAKGAKVTFDDFMLAAQ
jgi:hypothetical protein